MVLVECTEFASMYSRHCFRIMGTVGARFDADVHAVMSIRPQVVRPKPDISKARATLLPAGAGVII